MATLPQQKYDVETGIKIIKQLKKAKLYVSISVGVKQEHKDLLKKLKSLDLIPDFITIDIAHGHSIVMEEMLKFIKETFKDTKTKPFVIA
ncbi:guanosine 5 -monophosphate oxidoreductase, partial [Lasius niger]